MITDQQFWETQRLVEPQSEAGKELTQQINPIARRLLGHVHDFDKNPIDFLLIDEEETNGFFLEKDKAGNERHIVALSKGLLQSATTEDEIAFVLGHEFTHFGLKKDLGSGNNSQIEEIGSDLKALRYMYDAGYDPRAALKLTEWQLSQERNRSRDAVMLSALEVHGTWATRHLAIQTALTKLDLDVGGIDRALTPYQVPDRIPAAHHQTWFEQECGNNQYQALSTQEKIIFLTERVQQLENKPRQDEFKTLLQELKVEENDEQSKELLHSLADAILTQDLSRQGIHIPYADYLALISKHVDPQTYNRNIDDSLYNAPSIALLGEMRDFDAKRKQFIGSETFEDAVSAARELREARSEYLSNWPKDIFDYRIGWSNFEVASASTQSLGNPVPWDRFVSWSKEPVFAENPIREELLQLGIRHDFRLYDEIPVGNLAGEFERKYPSRVLTLNKYYDEAGHVQQFDHDNNGAICTPIEQSMNSRIAAYVEKRGMMPLPTHEAPETEWRRFFRNMEAILEKTDSREKFERTLHAILDGAERIAEIQKTQEVYWETPAVITSILKGYTITRKHGELYERHNSPKEKSPAYERFKDYLADDSNTFLLPADKLEKLMSCCAGEIEEDIKKYYQEAQSWQNYNNKRLMDIRKIAGYSAPHKEEDFADIKQALVNSLGYSNDSARERAFRIETYLYVANPQNNSLNFEQLLQEKLFSPYSGGDTLFYAGWRENLDDFLDRARLYPQDMKLLIYIYKKMDEKNWFPLERDTKTDIETNIFQSITAEQDSKTKQELIILALAGRRFPDPPMRSQLIEELVSIVAGKHGIDDLSDRYKDNLSKEPASREEWKDKKSHSDLHVLRNSGINPIDLVDIQKKLSVSVQSGADLAFFLEPDLATNRQELEKSYVVTAPAQGLFELLASEREYNQATIEFLSSALTPQSLEKFEKKITQAREIALNNLKDSSFGSYYQKFMPALQVGKNDLANLHRNFWDAPIEGRVPIMDKLLSGQSDNWHQCFDYVANKLFSPSDMTAPLAKTVLKAYLNATPDYMRGRLISGMMVAAQKTEDGGQDFRVGQALTSFAESMGDPALVKLLQALHSNPSTPDDLKADLKDVKSGFNPPSRRELYELYDANIPAELKESVRKLGKILGCGSYYITVEAILEDNSKVALSLLRENAREKANTGFKRLLSTNNYLEKAQEFSTRFLAHLRETQQTKLLERIESCTCEIQSSRDDDAIFVFMPEMNEHKQSWLHGVADEHRKEERALAKMLQELGGKVGLVPEGVTSSLSQALKQAQDMVAIETNTTLGSEQVETAKRLYDGVTIQVGDTAVSFETIPWISHGKNYKCMDMAVGDHFTDLPEDNPETLAYKTMMAKAYVTVEVANILKGGCFDHDRHGKQVLIDAQRNCFQIIDTGAMAIKPPSLEDKKLVGEFLYGLCEAQVQKIPLGDCLREQCNALAKKNNGNVPKIIMELQKGLLALSDFTQYLDKDGRDLKEIVSAVQQAGLVDKDISKSFVWSVATKADIFTTLPTLLGMQEKLDGLSNKIFKNQAIVAAAASQLGVPMPVTSKENTQPNSTIRVTISPVVETNRSILLEAENNSAPEKHDFYVVRRKEDQQNPHAEIEIEGALQYALLFKAQEKSLSY